VSSSFLGNHASSYGRALYITDMQSIPERTNEWGGWNPRCKDEHIKSLCKCSLLFITNQQIFTDWLMCTGHCYKTVRKERHNQGES